MTTARRALPQRRIERCSVVVAAEVALFAAIAPNFVDARQLLRDHAAERRARAARAGADAGDRHRRHRPVGRIDDGAGGGGVRRRRTATGACPSPRRRWSLCASAPPAAALNAVLIARLGIPPLIVTLGTFSLFRGIAEGITQAAVNYTGFPPGFLFLGQGYLWRRRPGAAADLLRRRSPATRCCCTDRSIGRGAVRDRLHAGRRALRGIPVARRVGLVYMLSGLAASLAAIIYVAHLGQAQVRRRHRLRAGRDHRGGARRARRSSAAAARCGDAARAVRDRRCCRTACGWRRCRRSWPAS